MTASLYYNSDFGYIICAETTVGTSMRTVIDPVTVLEKGTTATMVGNAVLDNLEQSRNAKPINREEVGEYKFWQVTGIKGFAGFSRKFQCVDIEENGTVLRLSKFVRNMDGSYSLPVDYVPAEISGGAAAEQLGTAVLSLFSDDPEQCGSETMTFETIYNSAVTYNRPSDAFIDRGDGHTDAYQVFAYEDVPQSYIAFLIDNGYSQLTGAAIKEKWAQQYGNLLEFRFQDIHKRPLICKAHGRTDREDLTTYLFRDGEGSMEVMVSIDLGSSRDIQEKIAEEFEAVVHSISM